MRIGLIVPALLLAACNQANAPEATRPASTPAPAAPAVMRIYEQTCKACHGAPASGAPQVGDRAAWAPRVAQGVDTLLDHTLTGFKGMPPLGSCGDCSEDDFRALIRYMAQLPEGATP